jgi:membrane associated rhomboid family serine protease
MAFLKEAENREPIIRAPLSLILLIGVIVLAHLLRVFSPAWFNQAMLERLAFIPARYSPLDHPSLPGSFFDGAVPFVGYIFLHANAAHLILNCLWLLAFGSAVARRLGWPLFLVLFFVAGIAGALAHLAGNWGSTDGAVGASGAIAGVMAAGIRIVWLSDPMARQEEGRLLPILDRQVLGFSIFWVIANVVAGYTGFGGLPGMGPIAWQAHLGGYFAGLLLIAPLDKFRPARSLSDTGIAA